MKSPGWRHALVASCAALCAGCSTLATLTGGYAMPLPKGEREGGSAVHAALGFGSGSRGGGGGLGVHTRWKNTGDDSELAFGPHLYVLSMEVADPGVVFNRTGSFGGYARFGLNAIEFEEHAGKDYLGTLGPSLDLGVLLPLALTAGVSVEHDLRFAGRDARTFVLFMLGFGVGGVGPF